MPELPEVEHVRRGLDRVAVGRRVASVEVGRRRSVRRTGPGALDALVGARVEATWRRGKYIVVAFDNGHEAMIHLRMSGRILLAPVGSPRPPHCHVVVGLAGRLLRPAVEVRFVDPRTFGEFAVYASAERDAIVPELARLGPDPLLDPIDAAVVAERIAGRRGAIKAVLLDQAVIAGIGNIYADEILHLARINPLRGADTLGPARRERLARAVVEVIGTATASGGSTLADTQYVGVDGEPGSYQSHHRVYGRGGHMCVTCGQTRLSRTQVAGRTTVHCRRCQR